ncbi:MAG: hypothetical protein CME70_16725 [Halobacteriovorax sp.]|nr:hypothetical protein [Halobacteriovorax sp.]|tara:strand:+ start:92613 stop:93008 length:396 start_codon:yes stop_codon:yes gene_type:complete
MKSTFLLILIFASSGLFAKSLNLEVSSTIKSNKQVENINSKLRVELNKEFTLPSKKSKILMRVEELKGLSRGPGGERPVLVSAEIYHIYKGEKELVSKPHIITHLGKEASFSTTDYEGREVKLTVKPLLIE